MSMDGFAEKIAAAKAMIKDLGGNAKIEVKVVADSDALKNLASRLADLYRKNQALQVKVDGYEAAIAKLGAVKAAADRLNGTEATVKVKVDVDRSAGLLGGLTGGLSGLFSSGSRLGEMLGGFGGIGPIPGGAGGVAAIAGITAAITGALPLLTMLTSGFLAAGAGAVAFGAMAYPAVHSVSQAYSQLKTAQDAYQKAAYIEQIDPTKAHATALKNAADALKYYQDQVKQLGPAGAGAVAGIQQLMDAGSKMQQAFQPTAFRVFADTLRVINSLMPAVLPMAQAFGNAFDGLLQKLAKFTQSSGFKQWISQFTALIGPSVTAIGQGIGQVAIQFSKLLTIFSSKSDASAITALFTTISGGLIALRYTIHGIADAWNFLSGTFKANAAGVAADWHTLVSAAADVSRSVSSYFHGLASDAAADWHRMVSDAQAVAHGVGAAWSFMANSATLTYHQVLSAFNSMVAAVDTAGGKVISFMASLPGRIGSALASLGGLLEHIGAQAMQGLLNGLESMGGGILGWVTNFANSIMAKFAGLLHLRSPSLVFYEFGQNIALGLAQGMEGGVPHVMRAAGMLAAATAGGGSAPGAGWVGNSGSEMVSYRGAGTPALAGAAGHGGMGGGGVIEVHSIVHLDSKEIFRGVQRQGVETQRRTGHSGLSKRTR